MGKAGGLNASCINREEAHEMAIAKRIDVKLTDKELQLVKWLADRDDYSVSEELRTLFYLQLREEMELYEDEAKQDGFIEE